MITKQQFYDLLVKSAYDGTFPGYDAETERCVYVMDNRACAVGVLLSDEQRQRVAESNINSASISVLCKFLGVDDSTLVEGFEIRTLELLQDIHDELAKNGWDGDEFVSRLNDFRGFADVEKRHV